MIARATREVSPIRTVGTFLKGRACSDTLFNVINGAFGPPLIEEERAAMLLAGGIMQHGFQCGMIWGAALAAGAQAYRLFGPGAQAETKAIKAAQGLAAAFRARHGTIHCIDITGIDNSSSTMQAVTYFLLKGGSIDCFRMAADYAPVAFRQVDAALSGNFSQTPAAPVSCAAVLARAMGVSDMHAVMAAGLAGGIGLSGSGCGALGAAIWIVGMNRVRQGGGNGFKNPRATEVIHRFMQCTGYAFECGDIVGRRFDDIHDHAGYLHKGGCAALIKALAAAGGVSR